MNGIRSMVLVLAVLAALALAADSAACTVCYGDSHDPIIQGAKGAVVFMVGVTYTLLSGGVAAFVLLRRRARRQLANNPDAVVAAAVDPDAREGAS